MKINIKQVSKILERYKRKKTGLIVVLQDIQETFNWVLPEALRMVSNELCITLIDVYSVAPFYRAFSLIPRGKHVVTVCPGTACHVRGAPAVLDRLHDTLGVSPGCTTADQQFTLESVNCLGVCASAPIVASMANSMVKQQCRK